MVIVKFQSPPSLIGLIFEILCRILQNTRPFLLLPSCAKYPQNCAPGSDIFPLLGLTVIHLENTHCRQAGRAALDGTLCNAAVAFMVPGKGLAGRADVK